jgi:membrane protease YdiL (CAAX protease family)
MIPDRARSVAALEVAAIYGALVAWLTGGRRLLGAVVSPQATSAGRVVVLQVALTAILTMALVALRVRRDRDPWRSLGLVRRPFGPTFAEAIAGAFVAYVGAAIAVAITIVVTRVSPTAAAEAKREALAIFSRASLAVLLPTVLVVGIYEEILFRGFFLGRLRTALGDGREGHAIGISAALFGFAHLYQGPLGVVQTAVAGLVLGALAVRSGSIVACIGAHVVIDVVGVVLLHALRAR